jgi:SAM-dependent methyltransferase
MSVEVTTFLGMPGYGVQSAAAGRGLWRARRDMDSVAVEYRQGSLLAANFNGLWCSALNLKHRGANLKYFAMLHDDIGPADYWLDALIEELEAKQLDVLGVVVPIKDTKGITSIAIDGDTNWRPKCRLTMKELKGLPDTFTSEDVGGPLLLNTGCWVARFDSDWVRKVHFTINDRIVFNKATDRYENEVESEDWYFSRLMHEMNLKIGATKKVPVMHRGAMDFSNQACWGQEFDEALVTESQIPWKFPSDIDGWLFPEEGKALADLSAGKRVLEIGSYCGLSTVCIARTAKSVTAVDYFDGRATPVPGSTFERFTNNLKRYGVDQKVNIVHPEAVVPGTDYDLVFIDGDHSAEAVRKDIETALNVLRPGGLIAFHDYRRDRQEFADPAFDEGVTESVNELISLGGEMIARHKTLAIVRPPQLVSNPA